MGAVRRVDLHAFRSWSGKVLGSGRADTHYGSEALASQPVASGRVRRKKRVVGLCDLDSGTECRLL